MKKTLPWLILALLCVLAGFLYWPVLGHESIFDDRALLDTIPQKYGDLSTLQVRLLSYGSFVWLGELFAIPLDGAEQRAVNVLVHGLVALGLFVLHRALLARADVRLGEEHNLRISLAVACGVGLFVLNPVAVYAVAYLVQRSILLATLFVVWGLVLCAEGFDTQRSRGVRGLYLAGAVLCYLLALLSKEHAAAAPAAALAVYVYMRRPSLRRLMLYAGGALLLLGAVAVVLAQVYPYLLARPFDFMSRHLMAELEGLSPGLAEHAWPLSILNQMALFPRYLGLWLLPWTDWMSIDMRPPFPLSLASGVHLWAAALYGLSLLGGLWLLLRQTVAWRYLGLCLWVPAVLFATEFVTVWVQDPFVLYRSYLWAIMLPGLLALVLLRLRVRSHTLLGLCAGLALACAVLTADRVATFENKFTLWNDAAQKVDMHALPNAVGRWRAFINRGAEYLEHKALDNALADYSRAVELGEPIGIAHFGRATVFDMQGRLEEARQALEAAKAQGMEHAELYYRRARVHGKLGLLDTALADYSEALARAEDQAMRDLTQSERSRVALHAGQYALAIQDLTALLERHPGDPGVSFNLGLAQIEKGDTEAALGVFRAMLRADPASAPAQYGLAAAYFRVGNYDEARFMIARALQIDRNNPLYQKLARDIQAAQAGRRHE